MTLRIDRDERIEPIVQAHSRRFDDELVVLDLAAGEYYALNAVGARIWEGFAQGHTSAQIARSLTLEYEVEYEAAVEDCLKLASDLLARGLVRKHV